MGSGVTKSDTLDYAQRNAVRNETLREVAEMVRDYAVFPEGVASPAAMRAEVACRNAFASAVEGMQRR